MRALAGLWALALGLAAAACNGGSTANPDAGTCTVAANAKMGCRAPGEPGCAQCCLPTSAGCTVKSGGDNGGGYSTFESRAQCPLDCAACAPCSQTAETQLCQLVARTGSCDCSKPTGVDPCFATESCACLCASWLSIRQLCPPP